MTINPKHKYLVSDMNGYPICSATTKKAALERGRMAAAETGLDMQVSYSDKFGSHLTWTRCKDSAKLAKRHYATNGQAFISR